MAEPARAPRAEPAARAAGVAGSARAARPGPRRPDPVELAGIRPVSQARRSDDLAGQIRALIVSDEIAEGARLPSERELAERFGASRPTVSQALRSLSLMGLVEIRHGSGAYVLRRPEAMVAASVSLMLDLDQDSVGQLMRLRLWLETIGAREAADRTPGTRRPGARQPGTGAAGTGEPGAGEPIAEAIAAASRKLRGAAGRPAELIAADAVFHGAIVRSAGNPYLTAMYESVHGAVLSYQLRPWVDSDSPPPWLAGDEGRRHWALHEPIARAVLDGDAEAAAAAVAEHHRVMAEHLDASTRWHDDRR